MLEVWLDIWMPILCVVLAMVVLLRCYRNSAAQGQVMVSAILLTAGAIWIPDVLLLLPLLWVDTRVLYCNSFKVWLASLIGVALVALYVGLYCLWQPGSTFTQMLIQTYTGCLVREWVWMRPIWEMVVGSVSALLGLIYTIRHGSKFASANVRIQIRYIPMASLWGMTLLLAIAPQQGGLSTVLISAFASLYLLVLYHVAYGFHPIPWRKIFPRRERRSRFNKRSRRAFKYYRIALLTMCLGAVACVQNPPEKPADTLPSDTIHSGTVPSDTLPVVPTDSLKPDDPSTHRNLSYLFDLHAVPEITITLTEADWNMYLNHFDANPNNSIYVPAQWTFVKDGVTYHRDSVGLRPRGNTSRRRPEGSHGIKHQRANASWHHAHFGICFTEYESGERFFGMDRVVLKWHKDDSNYCREIYCYDLFRRFGVWSAPRASYCRLNIYIEGDAKPAYFGVYELIEGVRSGYLDDRRKEGHLPDSEGNLWKAAYGADLSSASKSMGVSDDEHSYVYNLKTNKKKGLSAAQAELASFISEMTPLPSGSAALKTWLDEHMDVDLFLRAYAVNVMVGMWDDYWINSNNFYFYFDSQHRFYFIPYDYDNTLGTSGCNIDAGTQDMLNWGSRGGDRMLMRKVLSVKEYEDRYKAYIKELARENKYFAAEASIARIRGFQQMVAPYIANDTGEDMRIADEPASWSNMHSYRLLSGRAGTSDKQERNFFYTKIQSINF